ncbi:MAG TPA: metal-dependent hydrolase [Burkholderiaceae bacterium]|nr:metal-dependent hydrolase [Burkholderiaceae bacterium]
MDSLTQFVLGASVAAATTGRRSPTGRAVLWGGVCGTLPDLDAFVRYGDPILDMVLHRSHSHGLFWLAIASLPLGLLAALVFRERDRWRRWWAATALALLTHPLLDAMTVYGTQLARPFSDHPFAVGSIFIIDPMYTVPLLVGMVAAWRMREHRGLAWNAAGLALSTAYLAWSALAQQHVETIVARELARRSIAAERVLVTPTAFNTVLWRVLVVERDGYREGFLSLLDDLDRIDFDRFDRGAPLLASAGALPMPARLADFAHGFVAMAERDGRATITDLRMGQEPFYVFRFVVARREGGAWSPVSPSELVGGRPELGRGLDWLWRRMQGQRIPPPR